ncbi:MAG: uridine diphosphate-N-acetylglucosamine-binding protein YvcK [Austwickia sp.]|nr:uridine diphosphate-N-acetylglucosamine-binding protein YvcK [Austwickia sp.]MBK8435413.1 uridine diphosphate-N-acetylglucosamine-binding protein YvcK [Austwickia sp.]MBK9101038.1 uridine diphosphate-N-acetylglucosamine-binding protein YvcK [Austwickia sp.]
MNRPTVVAFGGGHGLAASLSALRHLTDAITAIVTVADDGGSSGRLRAEYDVLPPGDLRMALAALCDDSEWGHLWRDVLQHRFSGQGPLAGHALGNLLIVALWELLGDTSGSLEVVGRLLGARGRVLPMATVPLTIAAEVVGRPGAAPDVVRGQSKVARAPGHVVSVWLDPPDPPASAEAVAAIMDADWLVLGPGSWFTSVMPHLLVPQLREALESTPARRVLTLNLQLNRGETEGYSAQRHLRSLQEHAPNLQLDVVLADPSVVDDPDSLADAAAALGADLVLATVRAPDHPAQHDVLRLAAAYRDIFS